MRVYNIDENALQTQYTHKAAALDCCWVNNETTLSASLDKTVKRYLQTSKKILKNIKKFFAKDLILHLDNPQLLVLTMKQCDVSNFVKIGVCPILLNYLFFLQFI